MVLVLHNRVLKLYGRLLKLVDGEIWLWKDNKVRPHWHKINYSNHRMGYKQFTLRSPDRVRCLLVHRIVYKLSYPDWDINNCGRDNQIDHFDNNKTNNNIENLRVVNSSENQQNVATAKGYTWHKYNRKWIAKICVNYKQYHLGVFEVEEEAREAYLIAKKKYHISNCCL